jgi:carbamoylphosphate synthase large subunit
MELDQDNTIIVVGGGKHSILLIQKIRKLSLFVILIDRDPCAPGVPYADLHISLSTYHADPIIEELSSIFKSKGKFAGIVTRSSGIPVMTTAQIAEYYGLPGAGLYAAKTLTKKDSFAFHLKKEHLPNSGGILIDSKDYYRKIKDSIPCIIKPTLGLVGKAGVCLVSSEDDIEISVAKAKKESIDGNIVLEKFLPGDDISLFSIVFDGQLYPVMFFTELNQFEIDGSVKCNGFRINNELNESDCKQMIHYAQKITSTSKIGFSPLLLSFRLQKGQEAVPIEANLDFGGEQVLEDLQNSPEVPDFIGLYLKSIISNQKPKINFR